MIERAAKLEAAGASLMEIGTAIGLTESGAHMLLRRARLDGRLPPRSPTWKKTTRRGKATLAKVLALDTAGHTRREIAEEIGLTYSRVSQILSKAGRKIPSGSRTVLRSSGGWPRCGRPMPPKPPPKRKKPGDARGAWRW
jgi:DNA-binding CsgD family transcriptional regulator